MKLKRNILCFIALSISNAPMSGNIVVQAQGMEKHTHEGAQKIGRVNFPVSCTAASRRQFGAAVAMLHSFWYEEAGRAFAAIAKREPDCAIAYWGQAMSLYHPLWEQPSQQVLSEGRALLQKASENSRGKVKAEAKTSDREKDYLLAIETFYQENQPNYVARVLAYERAMEQLQQRYPKDDEAAVFYALALVGSAQATSADKTHVREKKAAQILNGVLQRQPQHPGVAHYLIHAYDSPPLAHLALDAARAYANIAPGVPHALHMPSHIFTRLGLWDESINSNLHSEAAAKTYSSKMHMTGPWDQQLHAMDYLMYAYLQLAEDEKAKGILEECLMTKKTTPESIASAYALVAIPARYALERRQWSGAAALVLRPQEFPWDRYPWAEAIVSFSRGVGAAHQGDISAVRHEAEKLATIEKTFTVNHGYNWSGQVAIQQKAVAAWAAHLEGKNDEALQLMRAAVDLEDKLDKHPVTPGPILPARELLGELFLELGQPREGLHEFEASLLVAPKRFNGIYGAARAAELAGESKKAAKYYQELTLLSAGSKSTRSELAQARAFLTRSGIK